MFLTNFSPQLQKRLSTQHESDIIISLREATEATRDEVYDIIAEYIA